MKILSRIFNGNSEIIILVFTALLIKFISAGRVKMAVVTIDNERYIIVPVGTISVLLAEVTEELKPFADKLISMEQKMTEEEINLFIDSNNNILNSAAEKFARAGLGCNLSDLEKLGIVTRLIKVFEYLQKFELSDLIFLHGDSENDQDFLSLILQCNPESLDQCKSVQLFSFDAELFDLF